MALLELNDLHTFFKTKRGTIKAVNGVSYSVEPGKTLGVVGESGSGKSVSAMSILKLLDGNGYIDSGKIVFDGRNLADVSIKDMCKIRGNEISVIFQEPMTSLNPIFTIERQVSEPFIIHQNMGKKEAAKMVVEMLKDVRIPNPEAVAAVRRDAPACDDCHGLGLPAEAFDSGRAYHSSGRDHPGADLKADE